MKLTVSKAAECTLHTLSEASHFWEYSQVESGWPAGKVSHWRLGS